MIIYTPFWLGCKPVTELPLVLNLPVSIYTGLREAPQGGESKASCPKTHRLRLTNRSTRSGAERTGPEATVPPESRPERRGHIEEKSRKAVKGQGLGISLP